MKLCKSSIRCFWFSETGAVTVDWVVLAGAAVAMGLGVLILIEPGVDNGATIVSDRIGTVVQDSLVTEAGSNSGIDP